MCQGNSFVTHAQLVPACSESGLALGLVKSTSLGVPSSPRLNVGVWRGGRDRVDIGRDRFPPPPTSLRQTHTDHHPKQLDRVWNDDSESFLFFQVSFLISTVHHGSCSHHTQFCQRYTTTHTHTHTVFTVPYSILLNLNLGQDPV